MPLKKGAHLKGSERKLITNTIKRRYSRGHSIRQIATSLGRSYGFVYNVLKESGTPRRPRGGSWGRKRKVAGRA